jgi:hypothetical protein
MKSLSITILSFLCAASLQAAAITWGSATDIAGVGDIDLTGGSILYAMDGGDGATAGGVTFDASDYVNLPSGVTFAATGGDAGENPQARSTDSVAGTVLGASTGDAGYDDLIGWVADSFGDNDGIVTGTMTFGNLVDTQAYQIQIWFSDDRFGGRDMTYGDGTNTVTLSDRSSGAGSNGQYAIGTFTASGTSQDLTMAASGMGNLHYNAILVQAVPEPSSVMLVGIAGIALLAFFRRKA